MYCQAYSDNLDFRMTGMLSAGPQDVLSPHFRGVAEKNLQESIGVTPECEISFKGGHCSMPGQQVRPGKQKRKEVYAVTVKISAKAAKNFERR